MNTIISERIFENLKLVNKNVEVVGSTKEFFSYAYLGKLSFEYSIFKKLKDFDTKVFEFDNLILIVSHGSDDGTLCNAEIIKTITTTEQKPVFVWCCHSKIVKQKYPELNFIVEWEEKVFSGDWSNKFSFCLPNFTLPLLGEKLSIDDIVSESFLKLVK